MNQLLIIRDTLKNIYSGYDNIIRPVLKVIAAFIMLTVIQKQTGYNAVLSRPLVMALSSVVCAFFPAGFISLVCAAFLIANMYSVSIVMAAFTVLAFIMISLLYFGFKPGTGLVLSVVPVMFILKVPFIVPVALGLSVGLVAAVPAALGVFVYCIYRYFTENAAVLTNASAASEMADQFISITEGIFADKYMYIVMLAFVLCIAAVSIISRLSIDHAGMISVSAGIIILAAIMVIGGSVYGKTSIIADIAGLAVSLGLAVIYIGVFYAADYRHTEHLRFEDDRYYYFVKAVPKITADTPEETEDFTKGAI